MAPRAVLLAPPARPPRYSLLDAAPTIEAAGLRWEGGWDFQPEGCGLSGRDSLGDCTAAIGVMDPATQPTALDGDPFWVWAADECSTFGFNARDWNGRARRQLLASRSYELANELWLGTVTTADSLGNRYLAAAGNLSDTVTNGATAVVQAIGCLEQALGEGLNGQQGMLHLPPSVLAHAAAEQVVRRDGNLWVSPMGHIVVADAGYTGHGPGGTAPGTSTWIYGTGMIHVLLGEVIDVPGNLADATARAAALERTQNTITVYAGQMAGFVWSTECAHYAAETDIDACLIGGAS